MQPHHFCYFHADAHPEMTDLQWLLNSILQTNVKSCPPTVSIFTQFIVTLLGEKIMERSRRQAE